MYRGRFASIAFCLVAACAPKAEHGHAVDAIDGRIRITAEAATVELQTAAISREDAKLALSLRDRPRFADGTTVIERSDVTETVEDRPNGIEQRWHFERAPRGSGDLVVAVKPVELEYVGSDASGLHFRDLGLTDVTYGHGTWVDAQGRSWPVPARYANGHIVLTVPATVLDASAYPAVLDPETRIGSGRPL